MTKKGDKLSIETIEKIKQSNKHKHNMTIEGSNNIRKALKNRHQGNCRAGKICYTNGIKCKFLLPEQFKEYEDLGWYKGTLRKKLTEEQKFNISVGTKNAMNNDLTRSKLSKAAKKNANKERFLKNRRYNWNTKTPYEEYIYDFMTSLNFIYQKKIYLTKYKSINQNSPTLCYPDYVNLELKLVIELDGKSHNYNEQDKDNLRTKALNYYGYEVFRFKNEEVYTEKFKNTILNIVSKRKLVMINNE